MTNTRFQAERRVMSRPVELMLASYGPLAPTEIELVRSRLTAVQNHAAGAVIRRGQGQTLAVVSGWVAWQAPFADGRRQIISLALPGELLRELPTPGVEVVYSATGPVSTVDATELAIVLADPPPGLEGLGAAWRAASSAAAGRWVCQMLRLGRMSAYERCASLILELHQRLSRAGQADERNMPLPLTQEMLSDFLGLSVVHVNRMLQQLRRDNLIAYRAGRLTLLDLDAIKQATGRT